MIRSIIAGIVATAIGVGITAPSIAAPRDRNGDGRIDWRDSRHNNWNRGNHYGWDRNHDGRVDWRDHRPAYRYGWDRNGDGRVDWRDRRAPVYYWNFGR